MISTIRPLDRYQVGLWAVIGESSCANPDVADARPDLRISSWTRHGVSDAPRTTLHTTTPPTDVIGTSNLAGTDNSLNREIQ